MQTDMAFDGALATRVVNLSVGGVTCAVSFFVAKTFAVTADFLLHGKPYTFNMTKWRSNGMARFIRLFYTLPRDSTRFGNVALDSEGELTSAPSLQNKIEMVLEAALNIFCCVDDIMKVHGHGVLDYANFYREKYQQEGTYIDYITKVACHVIVHSNVLAPSVTWTLVKFQPQNAVTYQAQVIEEEDMGIM